MNSTMRASGRLLVQRLFIVTALTCPTTRSFVMKGAVAFNPPFTFQSKQLLPTACFLSSGTARPERTHIGRAQMEEIIEDFEESGREVSQYCVIDVRTEDEVHATGKLGEHVFTLPIQVIMQAKVFEMEPADFEEFCGFTKPTMDETLVFTCAAGIRSVYACQFAAQAGYSKIVSYAGGANEWFSPSNF